MSRRRQRKDQPTSGTAEQSAPGVDASWLPPSAASAVSHAPDLDQRAVADLGEDLLRQAEQQQHSPRHVVDFDHDEIQAILRRASELGARSNTDPDSLDSSTLAEIAAQVGIPASAVAAAVAERRVGIDDAPSLLDRLIGPDQVWAERHSNESGEDASASIIDWLERGHGLRPRTTNDGVVVATRRSGLAGSVVRGVRSAQGRGGLGRVREVRATAVSLDDGGSVAMVADLSNHRTGAIAGGSAVATVGALTVGTVALFTSPFVLAALPVVAGAGLATSRLVFAPMVRKVADELDHTADQIASGEEAPSLIGDLTTPLTDRLRRR